MGPRSHLEPVELLEDVNAPLPDRVPGRLRRWWPLALVVALALVGGQLVLSARDRAEVARVAALPGVVPAVGPDVTELWKVDGRDAGLLSDGVDVAGRLVGVRTDDRGAQSAVALDPRTGAVRWVTRLAEPDAVLAERGARASATGCAVVPDAPTQVACLVT